MSNLIVFDTEATDLVPGQICQLSYLMIKDSHVVGKNMFFSVDSMSAGALEVHGLTMEALTELSGGAYFEDRAEEILRDFNASTLLVGHNVAADDRYLRVELTRCGLTLKKLNTFCTMNYATGIMRMSRKVQTGRPKPPKLEELVEYYEIPQETVVENAVQWFGDGAQAHDARYDTVATYLCLIAATQKGDLRGIL